MKEIAMLKTAVTKPSVAPSKDVPADVWIDRLGSLLKIVAAMEKDERSAAFAFLKSKFNGEWPRDDF
jgi:hypothetical protein